MNDSCEIVQDLLMQYIQGTLRTETLRYVENHLYGCTKCREEKDKLHAGKKKKASIDRIEFPSEIRKWKRRTAVVGAMLLLLVSMISWYIGKSLNENTPEPVEKQVSSFEE